MKFKIILLFVIIADEFSALNVEMKSDSEKRSLDYSGDLIHEETYHEKPEMSNKKGPKIVNRKYFRDKIHGIGDYFDVGPDAVTQYEEALFDRLEDVSVATVAHSMGRVENFMVYQNDMTHKKQSSANFTIANKNQNKNTTYGLNYIDTITENFDYVEGVTTIRRQRLKQFNGRKKFMNYDDVGYSIENTLQKNRSLLRNQDIVANIKIMNDAAKKKKNKPYLLLAMNNNTIANEKLFGNDTKLEEKLVFLKKSTFEIQRQLLLKKKSQNSRSKMNDKSEKSISTFDSNQYTLNVFDYGRIRKSQLTNVRLTIAMVLLASVWKYMCCFYL